MLEKYLRGTLSIIIKFAGKTCRDSYEGHDCRPGGRWRKGITYYSSSNVPVWSYDVERRVFCRPQNWRYFSVLIRVVQLTELVQIVAPSADKSFRTLEGIFRPLAGCYYSIAGGFEADPILTARELEVAILRPLINPDQFPRHVIEGGPQIVDSVAYYRGERARQFFGKANVDAEAAGCRVGLDAKSIWFFSDKNRELPFRLAM